MRRHPGRLSTQPLAVALIAIALGTWSPERAAAVDGDLDTSFGEGGSLAWTRFFPPIFIYDVATTAVVPADDELVLVATHSLTSNDMAFRYFDVDGESDDARACEDYTGSTFPFGVASRALAAGLADNGNLLVAGGLNIDGTEETERAFIARFDRAAGGCTLDTGFASIGFTFFDDFSFCDTESCSVLGLAQIRRPTLAVTATRIILLVRSQVSTVKGRLFLVGLTANGSVDNGFDGNGVLEILAPGHDGFYGEAHLEVDARGRIYVLATPFKQGGVTDVDLFLFRYLPSGGFDDDFSGDGILPLVESNSTDSLAEDLRIASDGTILVSAGTIGGVNAFVRAISSDGQDGALTSESLLPAQIAAQGDGWLVTSAEFLPKGGDGFRTHRRQFGTTGSFPLDPAWGTAGTADHDYDYEPGEIEGDQPQRLELWSGRPVIVGRAVTGSNEESSFLMRLESDYVFADGFEQGRVSLWSAVTPP